MSDSETDDVAEESPLTFCENMVVLKGEFDLVTDHAEDQIRQELVDVFRTKLPLTNKDDFEFAKRDRQTIIRPAVKKGQKWDFRHVKNLCGQGRLYCQLKVCSSDLARIDQGDLNDDVLNTNPFLSPDQNVSTSSATVSQSTPMPPMQPSTSSHMASPVVPHTNDKQLEELREIFPGNPEEQLVNTL